MAMAISLCWIEAWTGKLFRERWWFDVPKSELLVVERTIWFNPPLQARIPSDSRIMFRWNFKIFSYVDCTTSWGKLCQGSVILTVKKFFLTFRMNLLGFSLCPLPLILSLGTVKRAWLRALYTIFSGIYTHDMIPSESSPPGETIPPLSSFNPRRDIIIY